MELCSIGRSLIKSYKYDNIPNEKFSHEEIGKADKCPNTGNSDDEFGIVAGTAGSSRRNS